MRLQSDVREAQVARGDGGRWRWFGWFPEHRGHREHDAGGGARDLDVQAHVRRAKTEGVDVFDAMEA